MNHYARNLLEAKESLKSLTLETINFCLIAGLRELDQQENRLISQRDSMICWWAKKWKMNFMI